MRLPAVLHVPGRQGSNGRLIWQSIALPEQWRSVSLGHRAARGQCLRFGRRRTHSSTWRVVDRSDHRHQCCRESPRMMHLDGVAAVGCVDGAVAHMPNRCRPRRVSVPRIQTTSALAWTTSPTAASGRSRRSAKWCEPRPHGWGSGSTRRRRLPSRAWTCCWCSSTRWMSSRREHHRRHQASSTS